MGGKARRKFDFEYILGDYVLHKNWNSLLQEIKFINIGGKIHKNLS